MLVVQLEVFFFLSFFSRKGLLQGFLLYALRRDCCPILARSLAGFTDRDGVGVKPVV